MFKYKKILILGGPGAGKTTLAKNLSEDTGIKAIYLDGLNFEANWKIVESSKRDIKIAQIMKQPEWIMDGTYKTTLKERCKLADIIIVLDYSSFTYLKGVLKRHIKNKGKERLEIPGCIERVDILLLKQIFTHNKILRPIIMECIKDVNPNKVFIFKKQKNLNNWYEKIFKKKMKR